MRRPCHARQGLVTLLGFGETKLWESLLWASLAVTLAGVTLSATWWTQLRSYRFYDLSPQIRAADSPYAAAIRAAARRGRAV